MRIGRVGRSIVLCGVVSVLLPAVSAMAAVDAYMTIQGAKQGMIKGGDEKTAATEQIRLTDVVRSEGTAGDAASGMSSGKRQHGTITIVKEVDKASPMLFQAMSTNEQLVHVTIVFAGGNGSGSGKAAQKIDLSDAVITDIRKVGNSERITLAYQKIEVTYVSGGKSATDDWESPK